MNVAFLVQLSSLADQLKDLEELLRTKGGDLLHSPASTSTTHVPLSATESERQVRDARVCAHTISYVRKVDGSHIPRPDT